MEVKIVVGKNRLYVGRIFLVGGVGVEVIVGGVGRYWGKYLCWVYFCG